MKSAESSAGFAPPMLTMQSGALSMIAGMALLHGVAPALRAHGPLHGPADDGEHQGDGDEQAQHHGCSAVIVAARPLWAATSGTVAVSISVPSGSITCSGITAISG